jgi:hypothetical protein
MNTRKLNHDPVEPLFDEREWQAQERAAFAERNGATAAESDDPLVARYRSVSRALRQPLADHPPADFAANIAHQVAVTQEAAEGKLERLLLQVLTALLGLSGGVACMLYGREWVQAITRAMPEGALQWMVMVTACAGTYWALEQWRARRVAR